MQNIEIKSLLRDRAAMEQRLAVIGAKSPTNRYLMREIVEIEHLQFY